MPDDETRAALRKVLQDPTLAREIADGIAELFRQEYKLVDGEWWLFSLGRPMHALTPDAVLYAQGRGLIE